MTTKGPKKGSGKTTKRDASTGRFVTVKSDSKIRMREVTAAKSGGWIENVAPRSGGGRTVKIAGKSYAPGPLSRTRQAKSGKAAEVVPLSGGSAIPDAVWDDHLREILERRRAVYEALADK